LRLLTDRNLTYSLVANVTLYIRKDKTPSREFPALQRIPELCSRAGTVHPLHRRQPPRVGRTEPAQRDGSAVSSRWRKYLVHDWPISRETNRLVKSRSSFHFDFFETLLLWFPPVVIEKAAGMGWISSFLVQIS